MDLDADTFATCLDTHATQAEVEEDASEGNQRGVRGTPTFFVNGQPLVGAQPYEAFVQTIEQALGGGGAAAAEPTPEAFVTPTPATLAPVDAARTLGDPDAPVTIVEFSDYQCPYCARHFAQTWPLIKANFVDTGRVRYEFKDFPLTSIHPQAPMAHAAARCAGEQGLYWDMHDVLYDRQSEWSGQSAPATIFQGFAADLGLDTDAFDACLQSGRWESAISADTREGINLGVTGTPAFFIDGYLISGAQPYDLFEYAIQLAEEGNLGDAYRPSE